jgi:hypothetical protein
VLPDAYAEVIEDRPEDDVRKELPEPATLEAGELSTAMRSGAD